MVTIVAASVITAAAGAGITGDVAVPADGTGITGKHSVTDSVKAMMPVSVMDSGKAELWEISMPLMCVVNS